jgi:asparagine synthase (glutamine-hydrolysing)
VAAYNGEIYNYRELRGELETAGAATTWRGHSDTEVMLAAFEYFGIEGALKRFNGMFALALWDRRDCRLHLARDRFGEKPLYYGTSGEVFFFASELKALAAHPAWEGAIDRGALALYMRFNYVPSPHTIYRGVQKLPPGALLTVSMDPTNRQWCARPIVRYWSAVQVALEARTRPIANFADAKAELKSRLAEAVLARTIADVPLGAFLSGGIDSSTVVALMRAGSPERVRTFTIGFDDPLYDESEHARRVAEHLGTEHVCHRVTPVEAQSVIVQIPALYDEPFADTSQIPTYLVARAARQHVTVALTGDGGDELFGGYERYFVGERAMRWSRRYPAGLRRLMAATLAAMTPAAWDAALQALRRTLGAGRLAAVTGQRLHRLAGLLRAQPAGDV